MHQTQHTYHCLWCPLARFWEKTFRKEETLRSAIWKCALDHAYFLFLFSQQQHHALVLSFFFEHIERGECDLLDRHVQKGMRGSLKMDFAHLDNDRKYNIEIRGVWIKSREHQMPHTEMACGATRCGLRALISIAGRMKMASIMGLSLDFCYGTTWYLKRIADIRLSIQQHWI